MDRRMSGPQEAVTAALLRPVRLPTGEPVALITLDNGRDHTRPATFGPAGLAALAGALDAAEALEPAAIAITGKPYCFAAGADLGLVPLLRNREQAVDLGRLGHSVFRRLADSARPTFAFLNGLALGGGLELALHCTYRTISAAARPVALPECSFGLVPGWGGTFLLPNLIGAGPALQVIVTNPLSQNRMLDAAACRELGIADVLFEPADFLERSLEWAGQVLRAEVAVPRLEPDRGAPWQEAVRRARAAVDERLHGAAPAPYRAIELVAAAASGAREAGFAAEDEALGDLVSSAEFRAGAYAFDLVQRRAKRPAGAPDPALARPVGKVGLVGAGRMASQLAGLLARRLQVPVVLTDVAAEPLERGLQAVRAGLADLAAKGRLTPARAQRLQGLVSGATDLAGLADADLVIEAVFEDLAVKAQVLAELEAQVRPDAVLATNTSALSVTRMADRLAHPERVVGLHFFNPPAVMPLVEVVRGAATDDATVATGFAVVRALGKSGVLVRDAPAFVVNRLLVRFVAEVLRAVQAGTPVEVADRSFEPLGLPMSPRELLALVGPAVAGHTLGSLHEAFPERFPAPEALGALAGSGAAAPGRPAPAGAPGPAEIRERALTGLAAEVRAVLDAGVVAEPQDVDLCLLLGAGWPFHLGGLTPYLDRAGYSARVTGRRFLPPGVGS